MIYILFFKKDPLRCLLLELELSTSSLVAISTPAFFNVGWTDQTRLVPIVCPHGNVGIVAILEDNLTTPLIPTEVVIVIEMNPSSA